MTKIFMIHPRVKDVESFLKFAMLPADLASGLVWDSDSPDILFGSEWIWYKSAYFRKFKELYGRSGLKVAFLCEALEPDFNVFDYATGFSDAFPDNPRFFRLPSPFDMFSGFVKTRVNSVDTVDKARAELAAKTGFCNFIYSNPEANPARDELFRKISEYKRVDSLGRHLNNVAVPGTGYSGHSGECTPMKSAYKFSIASENVNFKGYTSEKLLTSLEAHTVPVYWGNPDVEDDLDPACFINAWRCSGFPELLKEVERVDQDDDLWCEMVSHPWMTPEQASRHEARTGRYLAGMESLLALNMPAAVPEGYHVDLYRHRLFSGDFPFDTWKSRIKNIFVK